MNGAVACWGNDTSGQVSDWDRWRYASQQFASVSAGSYLTCGILTNGSVSCWGYPEQEDGSDRESDNRDWSDWTANPEATYDGWVNTPPSTVKFKPDSLSVANYHACAIQTSGVLGCWGKAGSARLVIPTEQDGSAITDWTSVEAGWAHACGIREGGSVVCFGRSTYDRSAGPSGPGSFIAVTTGIYNGCALASDGSVECWGGTGIAELDSVKVPPSSIAFTEIEMSTSEAYTCGLDGDGKIHCWGEDVPEQLDPLSDPVFVAQGNGAEQLDPSSRSWSKLSVGGRNVCALDANGHLGCWGKDTGSVLNPPAGTFKQTDGGSDFSCAIKADDTVVCWGGAGSFGQIHPSEVPTDEFKQTAVGEFHACAIRADDTVACWGGLYRETAGGPILQQPAAVAPTGQFKAISAGPDLTCGIKSDDTLQCWGETTHDRHTVPSGSFTHVAVGYSHVCAINSNKAMECWGEPDFFDREGDGVPDDLDGKGNHTSTIPPSGTHQYVALSAGEGHTCAIRVDTRAVCWGYTADSRNLIPGSTSDPQGFGVHPYSAIATGGPTNCAIRDNDGSLSCWNSEKSQFLPPASIVDITRFKSLGAGSSHMCGIDSDDRLVCWGNNGVLPMPDPIFSDGVQ